MPDYQPGDVFQIVPAHGRAGWIGAFVLTTEVFSWGIMGFVCCVRLHDTQARLYIRLVWNEVEYVGRAPFIPGDEPQES